MTALRANLVPRRVLLAALSVLACLFVVGGALASSALASEGIANFETTMSTSLAGAHPDLETSFELEEPGHPEAAQNVIFNAPEGVFGNPNAIAQCTSAQFARDECSPNSQAGLITVYANYKGNAKDLLGTAPIYDLEPEPSQTALFAFVVPTVDIPIEIPVVVRTGSDYGLRFTVANITQQIPLAAADLTFWGFPASTEHNTQRFSKGTEGEPPGCPGLATTGCLSGEIKPSVANDPLTDNPTTCSGQPLVTELEVQTYKDPEGPSIAHDSYPPITECVREVFKPVLFGTPTSEATDSPAGLNIVLSDPQFEGSTASPSELKSATVTLPPGLTINPDAADGQSSCSDAQANFGSESPANCPDNSKIGTFQIGTPVFSGPLEGSVYIGEPRPGNQYRLFLIASGFGMNVKLVGSFDPDPETGRLAVHFEDLPQAPFSEFAVHLFAGERALMATPTACTIYNTKAVFYAWDEVLPYQESDQVFGLSTGAHGSECPGQIRPFEPTLEAGTSNPTAGAFSSFTLKLNREDGDQYLGKLNFTMPPGLTANLHGITYCPEASITAAAQKPGKDEQATPSCPASSQIGTTNVAAGPGSHPFHAVGKLYFAGPFQGAPLSLVAITPALAGPYDYGTVVVRVALHIDPLDAHVVADSETVPSIIGGVPLRMRSIQVNIDKPNFMINPTNCSPFSVGSEGIGDQGTAVAFSSYFHAVNCAGLPFGPKMKIAQLGGHKAAARGKDPSVRFDLGTRAGDANIKSIAVTLPNALEIDQNHLGNICAKSELEATHCAGRQPIGTVKDETPLLEAPLEGNAYAVAGYGGLPHVAFILGGQVMVVPQGESTQTSHGLRTEVPTVPDVPIGHFQLTLLGGKHGYLSNTSNLCARRAATKVEYIAQNGKTLTQKVPIRAACGAKSKRPKRHHH